jgi:hypothetical protein
MKFKRYLFEIVTISLAVLTLLMLSRMSPTTAVSPVTKYIPPEAIDPKILLDNPSVQERIEVVQGEKEQRGFGMGFQMRSNFWVDNEEISLVKYTADYADIFVTLYGPGKKEPKLQVVDVLSWGASPIVALGIDETDVGYFAGYSQGYLLVYPEIKSEDQFKVYCAFYKKYAEQYPKQKFGPILSYEYFSGRLDNKPKWDVVDESCFDFIALSSYPTGIYNSAEELPEDYYSDVVTLFPNKEIIFADVGWSTSTSSEEDQSLFLKYLYSFAKNSSVVKGLIYGHLFDPFDDELYDYRGTGLISSDEVEKPALATWKGLFNLVENK